MKMNYSLLASSMMLIMATSCGTADKKDAGSFDKQAHRGGRGLMPENTIASEKNAIDYDCTLEMDLYMSRDKQIVVSHDPYFNADFCLTPQGDTMSKKDGRSRLLYNMPYDSIARYDVGSKPYPAFPRQQKMHVARPLLSVLIDSVEAYAAEKHHVNHYNIELKTSPKSDGKNYSSLEEYVDLALGIIIEKGIAPRTMIQSFDVRALRIVHQKYPQVKTSFLVGNKDKKTADGYIAALGFKPDIFSPEFSIVTPELVKAFHEKDVLVIPWTPNTLEEIRQLKSMGVDGLITDYPDLYAQL
ncbi:glycerophosphodiester phosphodiesterase family protein [Compostibacter hankyongensis]|uniref:Glycerophosphodiester phosphodiesterase family protein n=1 Tax=Compostibacter hankyongensis TaxID=1007089 RepID=A0ABP8G7N2_9BACT